MVVPALNEVSKEYTLQFKGFIDLIVYNITDKIINLRVIDYKSGSASKKEEAYGLGNVIQHEIYLEAVNNANVQKSLLERVKELEGLGDLKEYSVNVTGAEYHFPALYEDEDDEIVSFVPEGRKGRGRLKAALAAITAEEKYVSKDTLQKRMHDYYDGVYETLGPGADTEGLEEDRIKDRKKDGSIEYWVIKPAENAFDLFEMMSEFEDKKDRDGCSYCDYKDLCSFGREVKQNA